MRTPESNSRSVTSCKFSHKRCARPLTRGAGRPAERCRRCDPVGAAPGQYVGRCTSRVCPRAAASWLAGGHADVELVTTVPEEAVGGVSGATSQKHRTSGGFRPSGQDVAKIVDGDQFQSATGHCGGHIVDGMRSLTVNLDFGTG